MGLDEERAQIYKLLGSLEDRITEAEAARQEQREDLVRAVKEIFESRPPQLTEAEHRWVQLAIQAEAKKIAFRQAVIEKTSVALIWAAIVLVASGAWHVLREWLINHGYKP